MYKLKVPAADLKFVGAEPIWTKPPVNIDSELGAALNWYNYVADAKDCRAFLVDWFKEYGTKDQLRALSSISDRLLPRTYANMARIGMRGFPLTEAQIARIWDNVSAVSAKKIAVEDEETPTEVVVKTPKVVKLASTFILSDVNDEIDNLIIGEDTKTMGQILMPYKMTDKQYADCAEKLQPLLAEYSEVLELRRTDRKTLTEDQKEFMDSFPFSGITIIKKIVQLIEGYMNDLKKSYVSKQVAKVRKKKPKDKTKLVKGIKYQTEDAELGLKSLEPVSLLNCSEAWVYDTKSRKITKYYSPIGGGITVKGASLVGYEESMSSSKMLRKPADQLKDFAALKKNDLTKWYASVKSKASAARPRLSATTIILKVF